MGRAASVTEEQVFDAIKEVLGAGEVPSWTSVRAITGSGSPDLLSRHIKTWFKKNGKIFGDATPTTLASSINEQLQAMHKEAAEAIANEHKALIEAMDERSKGLDALKEQLDAQDEQLAIRESAMQKLFDHLSQSAAAAAVERDAAISEREALRLASDVAAAAAAARAEELEKQIQEAKSQAVELATCREALAESRGEQAALAAQLNLLKSTSESIEQRLSEALQALDRADQRFSTETGRLNVQLQSLREQLASSQAECDQLRDRAGEKSDLAARLSVEAAELREQVEARSRETDAAGTIIEMLTQRFDDLAGTLGDVVTGQRELGAGREEDRRALAGLAEQFANLSASRRGTPASK